jgi:hypothetical protein
MRYRYRNKCLPVPKKDRQVSTGTTGSYGVKLCSEFDVPSIRMTALRKSSSLSSTYIFLQVSPRVRAEMYILTAVRLKLDFHYLPSFIHRSGIRSVFLIHRSGIRSVFLIHRSLRSGNKKMFKPHNGILLGLISCWG